jgi:hypothetical protein
MLEFLYLLESTICVLYAPISYLPRSWAGWVIFMLSPSFYTVERILPILLNDGCTELLGTSLELLLGNVWNAITGSITFI